MAEMTIRIGVLGCATIAHKVSRAINLSPNSIICAIGSRSIETASKFASENGYPESVKLYGSYAAVLDDPDVDAVYVPLPTSLHVQWAVLAAGKRKHLLLEKPVALNVKELDVILEACELNGVQFMDATMWMHHPRTAMMRGFLDDPQLFGELKSVESSFSFSAGADFLKNNIRVKSDLDGLGVLGDAGWYCIRAILWATNYELPKMVTAACNPEINDTGVILSCGASMCWEDGKAANFSCSFLANITMEMELTVLGTKGDMQVHDFVVPYQENVGPFHAVSNSWPKGREQIPSENAIATDLPQEALMVTEFSRLVGDIKKNGAKPEKKWPTLSRKTQVVIDAVMASIGSGFQAVEVVY